jgi:hypothetical protein
MGETCIWDCSYPTRLEIKEVAQSNDTGPPNQIQLIHGERYLKTLVTLHLLIPVRVGNGLLAFNLWERRFSRLYWLHEDIGPLHLLNSFMGGKRLTGFQFFGSVCFRGCGSSVRESVDFRYFIGYVHIQYLLASFAWEVVELVRWKKLIWMLCPLPPRLFPLSPPPPPQGHGEDGGLQVDEISRVW